MSPTSGSAKIARTERLLVGTQLALGLGLLAAAATTDVPSRSTGRDLVAITSIAVAMGIAIAAFLSLRRAFRVAPAPREDARLVRHGIYRWLRHPMYTAVLLVVAAVTLHQWSMWTAALATANVGFYLAKARYEESLLRARYPEYAEYRRRTRGVLGF